MSFRLKKLENVGLRVSIADNLREALYNGELKPGDPIPEALVASQLGVSRAPVREAILLLKEEGLVEIRANHGATVRNLSPEELAEAMTVRQVLEGMALDLAKQRIQPADHAPLEDLMSRSLQAARNGDVRGFCRLDAEFHYAFWRLSGHGLLEETLRRVSAPVFTFAEITLTSSKFDVSRLAELHLPILDFLRGKGPDQAAEVLKPLFEYALTEEWHVLFGETRADTQPVPKFVAI